VVNENDLSSMHV
jgi:hypothetical protein